MPGSQPGHHQHPDPGPVSLSGLRLSFPFMDLRCRSQFIVQHKSQQRWVTFKSRRVGMGGTLARQEVVGGRKPITSRDAKP